MQTDRHDFARRFFLTGVVATLSVGAGWGVVLLVWIAAHGSFTAASSFAVDAHGQAQIYGWVGLFVMGFAYQAFPRFWSARLAAPRIAWATLPAMGLGMALRALGEPMHVGSWRALALAGGTVELITVVAFAGIVVTTFRRSRRTPAPHDLFILSALLWALAAAGLDLFHLARTTGAPTREALLAQIATFQFPLRDLQIHGFAMMMILGVQLRQLPAFFGLRPADPVRARRLWLPLQLAVASEVVTFIGLMRTRAVGWGAGFGVAVLALFVLVALSLANLHAFTRPAAPDRSVKFIRAGHVWLLLSLAMLVLSPLYFRLVHTPFSHAWYGAMRHAVTVGFISLTIMGMAARVAANAARVSRPAGLWLPFLLVNLGCTLRVTLQVATDLTPAAFPPAGASGVLELAGLAIWGLELARLFLRPAAA